MTLEKCRRNNCYKKVNAGDLACGEHRALIRPETLDRIREAGRRRDWPTKARAVNQAVDELNGTPRPTPATSAELEALWRESALA